MIARYIQSNFSSLKYHISLFSELYSKKVWRCQKGHQKPQIEQCNSQQINTKMTNIIQEKTTKKTKDWAIWTQQKTGGELRSFGGVSSSCDTSHEFIAKKTIFLKRLVFIKVLWASPKVKSTLTI